MVPEQWLETHKKYMPYNLLFAKVFRINPYLVILTEKSSQSSQHCFTVRSGRTRPLLIGSVKSNMGHSESTSGLASLAKIIIAMERNVLPPNLHYKDPNPYIPGLVDGSIQVCSTASY